MAANPNPNCNPNPNRNPNPNLPPFCLWPPLSGAVSGPVTTGHCPLPWGCVPHPPHPLSCSIRLSPRQVTLNVAKHTSVSLGTFPLPRSAPPLPSPPPQLLPMDLLSQSPPPPLGCLPLSRTEAQVAPNQWPWQSWLVVPAGRSSSTWLPQEMAFPSFPCSQGQAALQLARVRVGSRIWARAAGAEADPDDHVRKSSSFSPGF